MVKMKNNMEKILLMWLKKRAAPPVKLWRLFALKSSTARIPPQERWENVWNEFKKIYRSDKTLIYNLSKKHFNLPVIKSYFRVEWDISRRTGREAISELEEKGWRLAGKIMPSAKILQIEVLRLI